MATWPIVLYFEDIIWVQYVLINNPETINVNLDQPSRAYWLEAYNQLIANEFIRINASRNHINLSIPDFEFEGYEFQINTYLNSDSLILHVLDEQYLINNNMTFIIDDERNNIGFSGSYFSGSNIDNINSFIVPLYDDPICASFDYFINDNNIVWVERHNQSGNICN